LLAGDESEEEEEGVDEEEDGAAEAALLGAADASWAWYDGRSSLLNESAENDADGR